MSRLRRLVLSDWYFFITCNRRWSRRTLGENDFALTAWVFLPDHWHALLCPPHPLTISDLLRVLKVSSLVVVNRGRRETGELWQERFYDHALRTVKEYWETVEYIHLNPVRRGLVTQPEQWRWSSYREYAGPDGGKQEQQCGLKIDRVRLPADPKARI